MNRFIDHHVIERHVRRLSTRPCLSLAGVTLAGFIITTGIMAGCSSSDSDGKTGSTSAATDPGENAPGVGSDGSGNESGDGTGTGEDPGDPNTGADGGITSDGGLTSDGGDGGGLTDAGDAGDAGDAATGPACIAACEAKYPNGALKGHAIDQCWATSCNPACTEMNGGALTGPATGACTQVVLTPSAACSQCTVDQCCAVWDACFGDAECTALNKCAVACGP